MEGAKYFYIALDRDFALDSDDSELTAWNKYEESISGDLNKVLDIDDCGGMATLSIDQDGLNDIIGFRIYAINADGSYVDPDGKAFYVEVGQAGTTVDAVASIVTVNPYDRVEGMYSDYVPAPAWPTVLTDAKSTTASIDSKMLEHIYSVNDNTLITGEVFKVHFYDAGKKEITGKLTNGDAWKDVKFIRTEFVPGATSLVDDHTYTGKVTVKDNEGRILATMEVSATKKLPTDAPADFKAKENQIVAGIHTSYLEPAVNGQNGTVDMHGVFNALDDSNYIFTFEDAVKDGREYKDLVVKDEWGNPAAAYVVTVAREFIDNTTEHATKVEYNWGDISFKYNEVADKCEVYNHTVVAEEYKTVFSCIYDAKVMTFAWPKGFTKNSIIYDTEYVSTPSGMTTKDIKGTNNFNGTAFSKTLAEFLSAANKQLGSAVDRMDGNYKSIALYSDINNEATKNEYFAPNIDAQGNLTFTPTKHGEYNNPTEDVNSTLRIVYVDIFGHDVVIELPVVVKKR